MKTRIVTLLVGVLVVFVACSSEADKAKQTEEVVKTVNVVTTPITPKDFASYVRVVGVVETSDDVMLSAEVSGKVVRYYATEGEKVRAGQTILKIDDSKLTQEKARLEAVTAQARENYERLKKVYEEDGIGSEMDYLNAKYNYEQSRSTLESINIDLANTEIKAPFNGTVESILYEVGEMVSPGVPVVRLIGTDNYTISAGVPARYSNVVHKGDTVDVWFDTQQQDTVQGIVHYVGNSINPQNRTFEIEISLPKNNTLYKVDMIANIRLNTYKQRNVIVVSEEFVYSKEGEYVVYVKDTAPEGYTIAKQVPVELGRSYKSEVIIENGLHFGDELITIGSAFLDDSTRIEVKNDRISSLAVK